MKELEFEDNEKEDLRTRRTKKFLATALIKLLEKEPLEKISVMDICKEAMVHRTTFYKHFEDKYRLFTYVLDEVKALIYERCTQDRKFESPKEMYMQMARVILEFVIENKKALLIFVKNNQTELVIDIFYDTVVHSIEYILVQNNYTSQFRVPMSVLSNFFAGGFITLAMWWLNNKTNITQIDLLKYIDILIDESIYV